MYNVDIEKMINDNLYFFNFIKIKPAELKKIYKVNGFIKNQMNLEKKKFIIILLYTKSNINYN